MKKILTLIPALLLCLSLAACGSDGAQPPKSVLEPVTDMALLDGMWDIDGGTKLYFNSEDGYYSYRSYWGLGGRGAFFLSETDDRSAIEFNGFRYGLLLRGDGALLPDQNGDGDGLTIHRNTFRRSEEAPIPYWTIGELDGVWQNAAGETIIISAARGEYDACSPAYCINGTVRDDGEGMGPYLYDNGARAYLCMSADGNSFTVSGEYPGRYSGDGHFDGVFYRGGNIEACTDLENAGFYYDRDDTWLWYSDGVNDYFLGDGYYLGDDGLAYCASDDRVYPAGWIPEERYDPSADWGDTFAPDTIPVLLGGALPFTKMQTLRADRYMDGTYYYADATEDGKIVVVDAVEQCGFVPEVQELADYLAGCALSLGGAMTHELLSVEENEEYGANLGYPVYIVTYIAGEGEEARKWTVFAADTGDHTYLYGFCEAPDAAEDMEEIYHSIFARLRLDDEE